MRAIPLLGVSAVSLWASPAFAATVSVTVHAEQPAKKISVGIYGQFLEHIFNSVHGGLWGDQVLNGTFELRPPPPGASGTASGAQASVASAPATDVTSAPPRAWEFIPGSGAARNDSENPFNAANSIRLETTKDGTGVAPAVRQRALALKKDEAYTLTLYARGQGTLVVTFSEDGGVVASKTFSGLTADWRKFTFEFVAPKTVNA